jgi:hypothetical protein
LNFGHCDLPFDLAQGGGELVEPFGICDLLFEIFNSTFVANLPCAENRRCLPAKTEKPPGV